jgi:Homeodomain-like domain
MSPEGRAAAHAQAVHAGKTSRTGVDPSMPGGFASLVERQQLLAELWVKGFGVAEIARTLGINRETVRRDVLAYQRESAAEHLPDLENARARTLELHRRVQQEA